MSRVRFFILAGALMLLSLSPGARGDPNRVRVLTVNSSINPITASFIGEQIELANREQDAAVLIQLDTPGGLDTAMRDIVQAELNSEIPVIVYIAPHGARAASAGALITLAADFAAMAPGTNIGAAHPVAIGPGGQADETMMAKVENDAAAYARSLAQKRGRNQDWAEQAVRESVSISAVEAVDLAVVDLIAETSAQLIQHLDGYKYLRRGQIRTFDSQGLTIDHVDMSRQQKILNALSNPTIAYLLMMLGIIGIFFEISQPGVILPGAIGAIAILLALFAFSSLPINYVGVLLILLAIVFFILEITVASYGMLSVGGIICLALGSLMLIDSSEPYLQISRAVIAATVTVSAGFFMLATWLVVRTQRRPVTMGQEGMVGEQGRIIDPINSAEEKGRVFIHGEYWYARAKQPVPAGTEVVVERLLDGLCLQVKPLSTQVPPDIDKEV